MSAKIRPNLAGKKRHNKEIDMEWVYTQIDSGRPVKSVAEELGVSDTTLRRRHREYQAAIQTWQTEEAAPSTSIDDIFDDIPMDFLDSLD